MSIRDDADEELLRVCIRHLAFIPCRHGRKMYDPCFVTEDGRAVNLVRNYHHTIKEHEQ